MPRGTGRSFTLDARVVRPLKSGRLGAGRSCSLADLHTSRARYVGPEDRLIGRLTRKGAHARLVLSVDLIGQAVSVEVDAADVRPY